MPFMKNALKPLGKTVLIPLALTVAVSAAGSSIKENFWIWYENINNFKWRNGSHRVNN